MFPPIEYLEWIVDRPEQAAYDLGSSDLRAARPPAIESTSASTDWNPYERVPELLAEEYGVEPDQVLVTAGATHANFVAEATAFGGVGSDSNEPQALVEEPGYEPLVATPRGFGARVERFSRPADEEYRLDSERVEAALESGTDLVVVTNRHNPGGRMTDRATLREVAEVVGDAGATLLVDEVYAPFTLEPGPDDPFGAPTAAGLPNTIVTSSLTKFFGLGSLRVGWLIGPPEFVERARSVAWHVPAVAEQSLARAVGVLEDAERLGEHSRAAVAENHRLLSEFVADRSDLDGFVAEGNTFAFLSHVRADGNEVVEAAWERRLLVVPGRFFDAPGRFRVSLGGDSEESRKALAVLGDVLDGL